MSLNQTAADLFLQQIDSIVDEYRISREQAFLRWICENILDISEESKIDEAVSIDGKDDRGIDIFHYESSGDETEQYISWIQAKFSNTLDHVITREEIRDFGQTIGDLESCPIEANSIFKQKSAEFVQLGGTDSRIRKRMYFVSTGRMNAQATELINSNEWKLQVIDSLGAPIEFEVIDIDNILSHIITPGTQRIRVKFEGSIIPRNDSTTGKQSIVGYIKAKNIVDIVRKHKETLFLENPRQTLGKSTPTNKAIMGTLNNPDLRPKFWKLNNGITAICSNLEKVSDNPVEYDIDNFKVVNGRQTTFTLEQFPGPLDDISLSLTVHEAVDGRERNFISQATNTQNPVKPVDLISNFDELNNLVLQCKQNFDEKFYFERQTKGFKAEPISIRNRITSKRVMEKNATARSFYAFSINPNSAMTLPDKDLFSVNNPVYYNQVFLNRQIRDLVIPHIFMNILKFIHKDWTDEIKSDPPILNRSRDKDILSKDIVKYYILRFISLSLSAFDDEQRTEIENKLIEIFQNLEKNDPIPDNLKEIGIAAYDNFLACYDLAPSETWPGELLEKINQSGYEQTEDDVPTGYEIMYELKKRGNTILPHLIRTKNRLIGQAGHDPIAAKLEIIS